MSLLAHGTQRTQQRPLLLLRHLGSSGSTDAVRAESPATSSASPTFSTFTTIRDTHEHTSIDDSFDTDPFCREPYPFSATSSEFTSEGFYNSELNDEGAGPSSPLTPEATSPLTPAVTEFGLMDTIGRPHVRRRISTRRPPTPCPEVVARMEEHTGIQLKIQRLFALARAGRQHMMEILKLSKDIEDFFESTPGVVSDNSDYGESSRESDPPDPSSPVPFRQDTPSSPTEFPFPLMPSPVSPNSPDATTLNETTLINTPTSPEQDQGVVAASPSVTAIASATSQTRLPRPHLAPLLIVRTPSLANVMAYTTSPSPSPLRVRFRPAASRSFSAPILFAGNRERLSPSSIQDTDSLDASESRLFFPRARPKAYYSPGIDGYASSTSSPKIDLKFEFEPVAALSVFEEKLLKSRFSSGSTIIPNKSKWYKPKLSFRHKNTDRILRSELAAVPGTNSIPSRSPNSDKQGRTIPGRRSGGESASFARAHPGRNQVNPMVDGIPPIATSGRWSADWDNVISQIGGGSQDGSSAESVQHASVKDPGDASAKWLFSLQEQPEATTSSLDSGLEHGMSPSLEKVGQRMSRLLNGLNSTSASPGVEGTFQSPKYLPFNLNPTPIPTRTPDPSQIPVPVKMSKAPNKAMRMISFAPSVAYPSSPSKRLQPTLVVQKTIVSSRSSIPRPRGKRRASSGLGISRILQHFPQPPRAM